MYSSYFVDALIKESQAVLNETLIDTSPYETINDEYPSGRKNWTFTIDAYPSHPADFAKFQNNNQIVDYTDDFKKAVEKVQKAYPKAKVIYVLP